MLSMSDQRANKAARVSENSTDIIIAIVVTSNGHDKNLDDAKNRGQVLN